MGKARHMVKRRYCLHLTAVSLFILVCSACDGGSRENNKPTFVEATISVSRAYGLVDRTFTITDPTALAELVSLFPQLRLLSKTDLVLPLKGDVFIWLTREDGSRLKVVINTSYQGWRHGGDAYGSRWWPLSPAFRQFVTSLSAVSTSADAQRINSMDR